MERIRVQYCGLSVRVGADDPAHLAWLAEFLSPHFEIGRDGPADCLVELSVDPSRYDSMRRRGPVDGDDRRDCFALDSTIITLPVWNSPDPGTTVFDEQFGAFYTAAFDGSRSITLLAGRPGFAMRIPLMRIVRELAMNHATRRGGVFLHASAFVKDGRGAIVAGPKASGKTTLLLHAIQRGGAGCVANDRVLVSFASQPPQLQGMPSIVTIREGTLGWFPGVRQRLVESRYGSRLTLAEARSPDMPPAKPWMDGRFGVSPAQFQQLAGATPVASARATAILFPRITGTAGAITVTEMPRAAALERLRASLLGATTWKKSQELFEPKDHRVPAEEALMGRCERLLSEVRTFQCDLGLDTYTDPRSAADLFERVL
jgi:hypothetical protein